MGNIFIRGVNSDIRGVKAAVLQDRNGDYIIFINTNLCEDTQRKVKDHELRHVIFNHFQSDRPIIFDELEAQ